MTGLTSTRLQIRRPMYSSARLSVLGSPLSFAGATP
jgi:hypothetical protein